MCEMLEVSRSGYYKWLKRGVSEREQKRKLLLVQIKDVFERSKRTYGSPRVHEQLKREGYQSNRKTVEKLMREHGIQPRRRRKFKSTTDSNHKLPVMENILERRFVATEPNQAWVSDITYIDTQEGWLYLAVFIDLYSRMVVGWSMCERMTADLVVNAFRMGAARRGVVAPRIVHSDRGSQYASEAFRAELTECLQSMSRKGNCWDNAPAESFFGTLKSELIYRNTFKTRKEAELSIFEFIEIFYNKQRLHSSLQYLTPEEFEQKGEKVA
jgi:transposase InsO family protein